MEKSRRQEHIQQQTRKNIWIAVLGIAGLIAFLFFFGIDLLINFSVAVNKLHTEDPALDSSAKQENQIFLSPPRLNAIPEATKENSLTISGYATNGEKVTLYVNNNKIDEISPDSKRTFSFRNVNLTPGENTIRAKVSDGKNESDYSKKLTVRYLDKAPELTVESPQNGQTFPKDNRKMTVVAKTNQGSRVTVNGFWAIEKEEGMFTYAMTLNEGENTIIVEAIDDAENKTTKEIKVKVE